MKPEEIIELAKKADIHDELRLSERDLSSVEIEYMERLLALHRQALIDSGELVPAEKVEADKRDAERYRWLRNTHSPNFTITWYDSGMTTMRISSDDLDTAIDRARSQP